MVCATVCLTVVPSFLDITNVSTINHSFKTDRNRTPLSQVEEYGDDIVGRELDLRKLPGRKWKTNPQPSEQLRPIKIKTSASTERATAAYTYYCKGFVNRHSLTAEENLVSSGFSLSQIPSLHAYLLKRCASCLLASSTEHLHLEFSGICFAICESVDYIFVISEMPIHQRPRSNICN